MRALARYDLAAAAHRGFDTLSGGQQARFQVLLLELRGATLLLLDEPTDSLDPYSADVLQDAIGAFDGTVLTVTHDRWLARLFTRFLVFRQDGTVYETGTPVWTAHEQGARRGRPPSHRGGGVRPDPRRWRGRGVTAPGECGVRDQPRLRPPPLPDERVDDDRRRRGGRTPHADQARGLPRPDRGDARSAVVALRSVCLALIPTGDLGRDELIVFQEFWPQRG